MRVVADTHAVIWYLADDPQLSHAGATAFEEAERTDGIWVPAVGLVDLWYAAQKRGASSVGEREMAEVKAALRDPTLGYHVLDFDIDTADAAERISKAEISDPFDRMIVATALRHELPLVTADKVITSLGIVDIIW